MGTKVVLSEKVIETLDSIQQNSDGVFEVLENLENFIYEVDDNKTDSPKALLMLDALRNIRYLKSLLIPLL